MLRRMRFGGDLYLCGMMLLLLRGRDRLEMRVVAVIVVVLRNLGGFLVFLLRGGLLLGFFCGV